MGINDAGKGTCTTVFMLPAIGVIRDDILKYGFINAYLDDVDYVNRQGNQIYLLFRPETFAPLEEFIKKEMKRVGASMVDDYDYVGGYVVTVHGVSSRHYKEYDLFLKGKYSRFSDGYKALFPEIVTITTNGKTSWERSLQSHIFNRTEAIRKYWEDKLGTTLDEDAEMWSKPDVKGFETLNIKNI